MVQTQLRHFLTLGQTYLSAASTKALHELNEHIENLLPLNVIPKTANGTQMHPIGWLPISFNLEHKTYQTNLHIYNGVNGIIL